VYIHSVVLVIALCSLVGGTSVAEEHTVSMKMEAVFSSETHFTM